MLEFWKDAPLLQGELETVHRTILTDFRNNAGSLEGPLRELLLSNGKMLRPGLLLLASMFGGGECGPGPGAGGDKGRPEAGAGEGASRCHRLAAAVELLHMATLVHDDIIDDTTVRRGQATLHRRYGRRTAVLIGDYLFSRSFVLAAGAADVRNARNLSQVVSRICASEIAQSTDLFRPEVTLRRYLRRIAGKTALLFALSGYSGAVESGCPQRLNATFMRIGYCIGMGFQIIDDILDFTGTPDVLGKPVGSDLKEGVFTLPLICALRRDDGALRELLGRPPYSEEAVGRIVARIGETGGLEEARRMALRYTRRAEREIDSLPDGEPKRILARTARKLLVRSY